MKKPEQNPMRKPTQNPMKKPAQSPQGMITSKQSQVHSAYLSHTLKWHCGAF